MVRSDKNLEEHVDPINELLKKYPNFRGDHNHLIQFEKLISTSPHTDERGQALAAWKDYNRVTHIPPGAQQNDTGMIVKVAKWQDYLKPRNVELQGIQLPGVFLGTVDLAGANLEGANLSGARLKRAAFSDSYLVGVDLSGALLANSNFSGADLSGADLSGTDLSGADFREAILTGATLSGAELEAADFTRAKLDDANLNGANLTRAVLVGSLIERATFDGAKVYGISAWDLIGEPCSSKDLVVSPGLWVDSLKVAQFLYLLYKNPEIRDVLDAVTRKVVLILGRFRADRKAILDKLRDAIRSRGGFIPVMFDFDVPENLDAIETVTLLARMARFVIADVTAPKAVPLELASIAPNVSVPIRIIVQDGESIGMLENLKKYPWIIKPFSYRNLNHLLESVEDEIIEAAERCRKELHLEKDSW